MKWQLLSFASILISYNALCSDTQTPRLLHDQLINEYLHQHTRNPQKFHHLEFRRYTQAWRYNVREGAQLAYNVLSGQGISYTPNSHEHHLTDIRKIIAFLYSISIPETHSQNGFTAGAFLVQDPEKRLYNFLYGGTSRYEADPLTNHDKSPISTQGYEIDINEDDYPPDYIAGKKTIYFAYDAHHQATYLRPESKSRNTWSGSLYHVASGSLSLARKYVDESSFLGSDDDVTYNKPHVPHDIAERYRTCVRSYINNKHEQGAYERESHRISSIITNLKRMQEKRSQHEREMLQHEIDAIYTRFTYPHIRNGSEIIRSIGEVLATAWYYKADTLASTSQESGPSQPNTSRKNKKEEKSTEQSGQEKNGHPHKHDPVTRYKQTIEKIEQLRHSLFLYRHPYPNEVYKKLFETEYVTIQDIEQRISDLVTHCDTVSPLSEETADSRMQAYVTQVAQRLRKVDNAAPKQRKYSITYEQLLDDETFA